MPADRNQKRWWLEARQLYHQCTGQELPPNHQRYSNPYTFQADVRPGKRFEVLPHQDSPTIEQARRVRSYQIKSGGHFRQGVMFLTPHPGLMDEDDQQEYQPNSFDQQRFIDDYQKVKGSGSAFYRSYGKSGYNPKKKAGLPVLGLGTLRLAENGFTRSKKRRPKSWIVDNSPGKHPFFYDLTSEEQVHSFLHNWRFMTSVAGDWDKWKRKLAGTSTLPARPYKLADWRYSKKERASKLGFGNGVTQLAIPAGYEFAGTFETISIEPRYARTSTDWRQWRGFTDGLKAGTEDGERYKLNEEDECYYSNKEDSAFDNAVNKPGAPGCRGSTLYWVFVIERYDLYQQANSDKLPLAHTKWDPDIFEYEDFYGPKYLTWREQAGLRQCGRSFTVPIALKQTVGHRLEIPLEVVQQDGWCDGTVKWLQEAVTYAYEGKDDQLHQPQVWWYRTSLADHWNGKHHHEKVGYHEIYQKLFEPHWDLLKLQPERALWDGESDILFASRKAEFGKDKNWLAKIKKWNDGELRFFGPQWQTPVMDPEFDPTQLHEPDLRKTSTKKQLHRERSTTCTPYYQAMADLARVETYTTQSIVRVKHQRCSDLTPHTKTDCWYPGLGWKVKRDIHLRRYLLRGPP